MSVRVTVEPVLEFDTLTSSGEPSIRVKVPASRILRVGRRSVCLDGTGGIHWVSEETVAELRAALVSGS